MGPPPIGPGILPPMPGGGPPPGPGRPPKPPPCMTSPSILHRRMPSSNFPIASHTPVQGPARPAVYRERGGGGGGDLWLLGIKKWVA